ncbi:putative reverse transcriptase domain-containing protein [Tanacetum coccineum]
MSTPTQCLIGSERPWRGVDRIGIRAIGYKEMFLEEKPLRGGASRGKPNEEAVARNPRRPHKFWLQGLVEQDLSEVCYHPRKANVVADALSEASKVENATTEMLCGMDQLMERKEAGGIYFIWVPLIGDVRTLIMDEAHASRLPRSSSGYDTNWVIVDRLTKSAYFLAIREDYKMEKLAMLYIDEIVAGHGVPVSIISDRDGRFTSRVLVNITKSLRDAMGYEYGLSSLDRWTKRKQLGFEVGDKVKCRLGKVCSVWNERHVSIKFCARIFGKLRCASGEHHEDLKNKRSG